MALLDHHEPTKRDVARLLQERHTTRSFTREVPPLTTIYQTLEAAQRSPSSTNIQPWHITIVMDQALEQLRETLLGAFDQGMPLAIADLPESHRHFRTQLGREVYGPKGYNLSRDDDMKRLDVLRHNFAFYDAPIVAVVGINAELNDHDVLSVGMHLQSWLLLLEEKGLATGVSVATVGYSAQIREVLGIDRDIKLLYTLHIGYEDPNAQINKLKMSRRAWNSSVRFVSEAQINVARVERL